MNASVGPWLLVVSAMFVGSSVAGCTAAEPKPPASVASASVGSAQAPVSERLSETNEKTATVSESTMSAPAAPTGQLVCRATADGNAHQIFLEWNGDTAKGTLRTSTPSGMVRLEPIKAERYKARIIIDDPTSEDLAVHKATLVEDRKGKQLQMGDHTQPWTQCN